MLFSSLEITSLMLFSMLMTEICFIEQAPTHSTMISLDSDSSPNNSPLREVEIDQKRSLFHETSYFSEENKDKHTTLNDSKTADGPPNKRSKGKSPKKQITIEDVVPKKKKKQDNHKKNEGSKEGPDVNH